MLKVFECEANGASITAYLWGGGSKAACFMHKLFVLIHSTSQNFP
jgi:hypothetical protein